ncbi:hypothetical protein UREOM_1180 [Ureaplasma sp. OM1]|uniref:Transposase IS30-like HTH domain-containing protein n=1 Tax=Ureaplasma ceti TaxID=3119530 RepID=A0ABP9U8K4_9BACT
MYYQLSKEERYTIDKLFNQERLSIIKIAKFLNRSPSTISRELNVILLMDITTMNMLINHLSEEVDTIIQCIY